MSHINILRKANVDDCDFVFKLRNSWGVRRQSWNINSISREEHIEFWKKNFLNYWIITRVTDDKPIGFVRIIDGEVSIAIDSHYRNEGYGSKAIEILMDICPEMMATVKLSNNKSLAFFLRNDFKIKGFVLSKVKK